MKTKIILIRHGESLGNARRMLLGHTDMDLTELGYRQAEATAEALKDERIDVIYSSDLLRAMNTAVPNATLRGIEVIPDRELREIYLGDWEGRSVEDVMEQYGRDTYLNDWVANYGTFVMPRGESTWECGERFLRETRKIAEANEGKTVLIVAHGAVIRSFFANISGYTAENMSNAVPFAANASYSIAYYENGVFTPSEYSVDGHLASVGITKINW